MGTNNGLKVRVGFLGSVREGGDFLGGFENSDCNTARHGQQGARKMACDVLLVDCQYQR
ncbi:MAG: hypothetical protein QOF74_1319 [Caballeronia mineralivorans]|jgi:hypothetical protein|nr:hypothetical protein [Caballeronia mineralivorans]